MIDPIIINGLKRVDVSKDKEKTKERVETVWKSATRGKKLQVLAEAGIKATTIYRIFREGAITPKVAVVMAEVLNADPFYLTGEADENGGWSKPSFERFLRENGYGKLLEGLSALKPRKKYQRRAVAEDYKTAETAETAGEGAEDAVIAGYSQDELLFLLRALSLRARSSAAAKERLEEIAVLLTKD